CLRHPRTVSFEPLQYRYMYRNMKQRTHPVWNILARSQPPLVKQEGSKTMEELERFMTAQGGITSVPEFAHFLGVPRSELREACAERGVKRVGSAFVIDFETARDLAEEFGEDTDVDEDDEDDLEDETDETDEGEIDDELDEPDDF